jgi:hypothetical protein
MLNRWATALLTCMLAACATTTPVRDACSLLTPADLEEIQGERPADRKASQQGNVEQCFYQLPTFTKSINLGVQSEGREFWQSRIRGEHEEEEEREAKAEPREIEGIGDEAVWVVSPVGGTLHVLANDTVLHVSIGGNDKDAVRLEKASALAKRALKRLHSKRE